MPRYTTGAAVGVFGIKTALGCGVGEKVGNVGWSVGEDRTANTLETIIIIKKRYDSRKIITTFPLTSPRILKAANNLEPPVACTPTVRHQ